VYRQGEPADALFYIEKGMIQLTVKSGLGKEGVTAILSPGAFFGEACLEGQPHYMGSALVTANAVVRRIEKKAMVRVLRQQAALAEVFTSFLIARNIQIEADLVDQLFSSSEQRLARLLLLFADLGKDGKVETVMPNISQKVLAAKVGTTRSRINFFMNKFRRLGFIEYNGVLKVRSSLSSVVVH
jgi:CRP-like cAMP-binding protein